MRLPPQSNPLCQRLACDHPLKGARREGHFDMGMGPCKTPGCQCPSFVFSDPSLLMDFPGRPPVRRVASPVPMHARHQETGESVGQGA